ncbi:hypothetical protein [Anaeromicrobium sediminis]|uniref:hypothetical protein n=1 Tax=Anaeromicrobium sediminis TaxID=1478221 RepID=UPI001594EB96|nr:hypothetical protein [Anaeromicrobium sediminis]
MRKDKNRRETLMEYPEGEYGEVFNTKRKSQPVVGNIEDKIIIINPTNKEDK